MGVGPNHIISKGLVADGTTAYVAGLIGTLTATEAHVALAGTADVLTPLVVIMEDMTAVRLIANPGKIVINCAFMGIVRVTAGAAVAIGDRVTNDTTSRAVTRARTAGGSQGLPVLGIALTAAAAAGTDIDVLLTPGATF